MPVGCYADISVFDLRRFSIQNQWNIKYTNTKAWWNYISLPFHRDRGRQWMVCDTLCILYNKAINISNWPTDCQIHKQEEEKKEKKREKAWTTSSATHTKYTNRILQRRSPLPLSILFHNNNGYKSTVNWLMVRYIHSSIVIFNVNNRINDTDYKNKNNNNHTSHYHSYFLYHCCCSLVCNQIIIIIIIWIWKWIRKSQWKATTKTTTTLVARP